MPITISFISCEFVTHMDQRNTCKKNKTIKESIQESSHNYNMSNVWEHLHKKEQKVIIEMIMARGAHWFSKA